MTEEDTRVEIVRLEKLMETKLAKYKGEYGESICPIWAGVRDVPN